MTRRHLTHGLLAAGIIVFATGTLFAQVGEMRSVSVQEAQLRERPQHLSRIVDRLEYADEVEVTDVQRGWYRIRIGDVEGWLHESALSEERIVLADGGEDAARDAGDREVALAGRGFNQEVEQQYIRDSGISFEAVDRIEAYTVDIERMQQFLAEGSLSIPGEDE